MSFDIYDEYVKIVDNLRYEFRGIYLLDGYTTFDIRWKAPSSL